MSETKGPQMESELGRVRINAPNRGSQPVITVDDPTDAEPAEFLDADLANLRYSAETARKEKQQNRMEVGAKKRLEILTNLGRATDIVDVEGINFSIRTLKNGEWREAVKAVSLLDLATEQAYEMRAQILARALYAIDNQPVEIVLGTDDIIHKIAFIQEMDETAVAYLYNRYTDMAAKNKAKFNLNTEEGVKEAVEEIKKS
jgi:thiamine biosynthesis protein ThiC